MSSDSFTDLDKGCPVRHGDELFVVTPGGSPSRPLWSTPGVTPLGHKRACAVQKGMSALPSKADMCVQKVWIALAYQLPPIIMLLGSNALRVSSHRQLFSGEERDRQVALVRKEILL
jgi:hypothetical protein